MGSLPHDLSNHSCSGIIHKIYACIKITKIMPLIILNFSLLGWQKICHLINYFGSVQWLLDRDLGNVTKSMWPMFQCTPSFSWIGASTFINYTLLCHRTKIRTETSYPKKCLLSKDKTWFTIKSECIAILPSLYVQLFMIDLRYPIRTCTKGRLLVPR